MQTVEYLSNHTTQIRPHVTKLVKHLSSPVSYFYNGRFWKQARDFLLGLFCDGRGSLRIGKTQSF